MKGRPPVRLDRGFIFKHTMLAKRIIPCLDVSGGRVVKKGVKFVELRDAGDRRPPAPTRNRGPTELPFLDITASHENSATPCWTSCAGWRAKSSCPSPSAGRARAFDDVRRLLEAGADKVSINTAAILDPDLINQTSVPFGCQCIVVAIDARRRDGKSWEVFTHGGRRGTGLDAVAWAKSLPARGGEIPAHQHGRRRHQGRLRPGTDRRRLQCGVGAGHRLGRGGHAGPPGRGRYHRPRRQLLAASIFHFGEFTIRQVKEHMAARGVPVRLEPGARA